MEESTKPPDVRGRELLALSARLNLQLTEEFRRDRAVAPAFVIRIKEFMLQLAEAGNDIWRPRERHQIEAVLGYWASVLRLATGTVIFAPPLAEYIGAAREDSDPSLSLPVRMDLQSALQVLQAGKPLENCRVVGGSGKLEKSTRLQLGRAAVLSNCHFTDCNLDELALPIGSKLVHVAFKDCSFEGINWSRIHILDCSFHELRLETGTLREVTLTTSIFRKAEFGPDTRFTRCNFSSGIFDGAQGKGARFEGCDFSNARMPSTNFRNCNLSGASFVRTMLDDARFDDCNLTKAQFVDCDLDRVTFVRATTKGANLVQARGLLSAEIVGGSWSDAILNENDRDALVIPESLEAAAKPAVIREAERIVSRVAS